MSPALLIGAAALGGIIAGLIAGVLIANRRNRNHMTSIGEEVARLRNIAEGKLSEDDPDLPERLRELNSAIEETYRAVDALETQSALMREKSASARDVVSSVKEITSMIEDLGADVPYMPAARAKALSASLDKSAPTPHRKLR